MYPCHQLLGPGESHPDKLWQRDLPCFHQGFIDGSEKGSHSGNAHGDIRQIIPIAVLEFIRKVAVIAGQDIKNAILQQLHQFPAGAFPAIGRGAQISVGIGFPQALFIVQQILRCRFAANAGKALFGLFDEEGSSGAGDVHDVHRVLVFDGQIQDDVHSLVFGYFRMPDRVVEGTIKRKAFRAALKDQIIFTVHEDPGLEIAQSFHPPAYFLIAAIDSGLAVGGIELQICPCRQKRIELFHRSFGGREMPVHSLAKLPGRFFLHSLKAVCEAFIRPLCYKRANAQEGWIFGIGLPLRQALEVFKIFRQVMPAGLFANMYMKVVIAVLNHQILPLGYP